MALLLLPLAGVAQAEAQTFDINGLEPVLLPDGRYPASYAVWTRAEGGELHWEADLGEVTLEGGKPLVAVDFSSLMPPGDGDLWAELSVGGVALEPRVAVSATAGVSIEEQLDLGGRINLEDAQGGNTDISNFFADFNINNFAAGEIQFGTNTNLGQASPRLRIANTGLVYVSGGGDAKLTPGSGYMVIGREISKNLIFDSNEIMARDNGSTATLFLQQDGGAVFVNGNSVHSSDARLKRDIREIDSGLAEVLELRPVSFSWRNGDDRRHLGLIAQEVEELSEDLIYENEEGFKGVAYIDLVPLLIRAVQEQEATIAELRADLEELRGR